MVDPIITCGMRDWILEMNQHTSEIQEAIDAGEHDVAWRKIHEFQTWCGERITAQDYKRSSALSLLGVPHKFFARVLVKESRFKPALVHLIFEAASDHRDLKGHPKSIAKLFKKCRFENTQVDEAHSLYAEQKGAADFMAIRNKIADWS